MRFRQHGLPLIDEQAFADMYHNQMGAPNKSVRLMIGTLILKDVFDLNRRAKRWMRCCSMPVGRWRWTSIRQQPSFCQKTLHNFRVALMEFELGPMLFEQTTTGILAGASIWTSAGSGWTRRISRPMSARPDTAGNLLRNDFGCFLRDLKPPTILRSLRR